MKIEKINENQIRCTLTREDLATRHLNLSELAYGTEKAKLLFRDMMQQAHYEYGFDAENTPLMIEAIPISMDSLVLIITKVEEPDELDTRFSRFSESGEEKETVPQKKVTGADDIIDLFQKLYEARNQAKQELEAKEAKAKESPRKEETTEAPMPAPVNLVQSFRFHSLDHVIQAAKGLQMSYGGDNSLYKEKAQGTYRLVVHQSSCSPEHFNKVCNILSEYGCNTEITGSGEAYLKEHEQLLLDKNALQKLETL